MYRNFVQGSKLLFNTNARLLGRGFSVLPRPQVVFKQSEATRLYKKGQVISGFTVDSVTPVEELNLTAIRLTHRTGADYLHIARDDSNNVFCVGFRTVPSDSTGVAHVLEHVTLCGSKKYPCRDPFFKMLNRSLTTFMNAFTGSDFTAYPFSTQNSKDFNNMLEVYLDAVFNPCLRELDFLQEGWRLEHAEVGDQFSPIIFKGVVFNEMKGAFTDSERIFSQKVQNYLLPSHTYKHVSGGEPLFIPDLSWSQLKKFHSEYYNPANARFYTYGDIPLENHLSVIDNVALKHYTPTGIPSGEIQPEVKWSKSKEYHITCSPDPLLPDPTKNTTVCSSYLLNDVKDFYETSVLQIISELLINGPTSPFYQSLLEPNIGLGYSASTGFDGNLRNTSFSVGLRGVTQDDVNKIFDITNQTFQKVVETGFPADRVEAVLHSIELGLKHQTADFGLNLALAVTPIWNHGGDPVNCLKVNDQVQKFKNSIKKNPRYLSDKVQEHFVENKHKMLLVMTADKEYETKLLNEETSKLKSKLDSLSVDDKTRIHEKGIELRNHQNAEDDISCLPTLKVSDVEPQLKNTVLSKTKIGGTSVQICEQPTSGVTYFRAVLNTSNVPEHLQPLLPLFCQLLTNVGTQQMDYKSLAKQIELKTGGLQVKPLINDHHTNEDVYEEGILLSSHCLDKNTADMFNLWMNILNEVTFSDTERLVTLIRSTAAQLASSVPDSGHNYALMEAASSLSASAMRRQQFQGMEQVALMKKIAASGDMSSLGNKMAEIRDVLIDKQKMRCAVNSLPSHSSDVVNLTTNLLTNLRSCTKPTPPIRKPFEQRQARTYHLLPYPISFVGKSVLTVPYMHQDYASLRVLAKLMSNKFLHREIREKGGAYGGGAVQDFGRNFMFYSYRDPRGIDTLATFSLAVDWAKERNFSQQDIDEAKLSIFSTIDRPVAPGERGALTFVYGIDDIMRQTHRERLFGVSKDDLVSVAEKYFGEGKGFGVAALGPGDNRVENDEKWTVIREN